MKKTTKFSFILSVFMMVLSVSMLVGTTFAWFTDSASTGVNKIQAGNLAIELVDASGVSLEGKTLGWDAFDKRAQDEILWEPGATYKLEPFYIKNSGSLNLKFKFEVSGIDGDAKLLEVLEFKAMADASWFKFNTGGISVATSGEFDMFEGYDLDTIFYGVKHFDEYVLEAGKMVGPFVIEAHMKADAGNEYQGLVVDGIAINVIAAQATGEEDSFDGTYDEKAKYVNLPKEVELSAEDIQELNAQTGYAASITKQFEAAGLEVLADIYKNTFTNADDFKLSFEQAASETNCDYVVTLSDGSKVAINLVLEGFNTSGSLPQLYIKDATDIEGVNCEYQVMQTGTGTTLSGYEGTFLLVYLY